MATRLNKLEQRKLDKIKQIYPQISSEEALLMAIEAERFKHLCSYADPAWAKFAGDQMYFEEIASLLEREAYYH